ncbi:MAG TPA: YdcF family protein [Clostridiaceae bacterium]|nr:YdcF family protein [Clostridiaceae bacterium]
MSGTRLAIRRVIATILVITGILLCMNTIFAHNYSNDWNLGVILPAIMGLFCFAFSVFLFSKKEHLIRNRTARRIFTAAVIFCLLVFVTVEAMIIIDPYIHGSDDAGYVDTVIVLGCGIWPDGRPTLALAMRLDKTLDYYRENPHVTIIVSGGQGVNEPFPEAAAMKDYLVKKGVPEDKIIVEDKSTSTRENFEFSRKLMNIPDGETRKIIFVTNDFHILRSRILAKRFGFDAYAIAAHTPEVVLINSYLREFFAFIKSMLVDY